MFRFESEQLAGGDKNSFLSLPHLSLHPSVSSSYALLVVVLILPLVWLPLHFLVQNQIKTIFLFRLVKKIELHKLSQKT